MCTHEMTNGYFTGKQATWFRSSATLEAKLYQIRFLPCPPKLENTTSFDSPLSRQLQDVVQTLTLPIIILLVF